MARVLAGTGEVATVERFADHSLDHSAFSGFTVFVIEDFGCAALRRLGGGPRPASKSEASRQEKQRQNGPDSLRFDRKRHCATVR